MSTGLKIGFLGAGKMATALARGFIQAGIAKKNQILAGEPVDSIRNSFARETGATATAANLQVVKGATVLLLAVKPDHVTEVLAEIKPHWTDRHLLISIAAGVPISRLERQLPAGE